MRLIDADALKKNVRNKCWMPDWCYVLIDAAIADMPTIEERKRGKRVPYEDEDGEHYGDKCSECGEWYAMLDGKTNYCPNCGADMRGENDE